MKDMLRKIREEWRRREKKNEDDEADDENWMIERKNYAIFYENVLAFLEGI